MRELLTIHLSFIAQYYYTNTEHEKNENFDEYITFLTMG